MYLFQISFLKFAKKNIYFLALQTIWTKIGIANLELKPKLHKIDFDQKKNEQSELAWSKVEKDLNSKQFEFKLIWTQNYLNPNNPNNRLEIILIQTIRLNLNPCDLKGQHLNWKQFI